MKTFWSVAACVVPTTFLMAQERLVSLNDGWSFRNSEASTWTPAEVPGTVHTDLMRAGLIPDPFVGSNVDSVQWIEDHDWYYRRELMVDADMLACEHIELVFKGLDTFADIRVNGTEVGRADNMFRTWTFPIRHLLREGVNEIVVLFRSAIAVGERRRMLYRVQLPADNDAGRTKVSPYVRKAAYQFGWDFAPRLVTAGIWQPVELRCWSGARIAGVHVSHAFAGDNAVVGFEARIEGALPGAAYIAMEIDGDRTLVPLDARSADGLVHASISLRDARRWWPNGEGEQVLYPLQVELLWQGRAISSWERRIGLRTVSLGQHAGAFTFMVNGRPLFAKGANLVPPDMFLPRAGDSAWVRLVGDMERAHFNMVRVWAGGVYPPDAFFDACDSAGILVWEDLMFANMAPGDSAFLANVELEVAGQAQRLHHHPSLALWCGNNELDVAWRNWGWQKSYGLSPGDSARIWSDHVALFKEAIPRWISTWSDLPYTPTSPLSNWGSTAGLEQGDLHDWEVWHGDGTFDRFSRNVGRFVSEHGFQSYPDSSTMARYLPAGDLVLGSPALAHRQRSYKTDRPILEAIRRELNAVPRTLGEFIRYSQEVQARACTMAIQAHLAGRPHCMGTLFWQLNDAWPGPSWSAIDYLGRWKPAMHAVQKAFAP